MKELTLNEAITDEIPILSHDTRAGSQNLIPDIQQLLFSEGHLPKAETKMWLVIDRGGGEPIECKSREGQGSCGLQYGTIRKKPSGKH